MAKKKTVRKRSRLTLLNLYLNRDWSLIPVKFKEKLPQRDLLFPGHYGNKPTFRQIIAHNIRYKDLSINNTLKNLDSFTRDDEYETLYLFLFGCDFEQGDTKQELRSQIDIEEKFKKRLEPEQTK